MVMIQFNETLTDCWESIMESIKYELEDIIENDTTKEIYFWDICHENIDNAVSSNNREENLKVIDDLGNENEIDEGLVDRTADIYMQLAQIAYGCIEMELINDELFANLQEQLNNEKIDSDTAKEILESINNEIS